MAGGLAGSLTVSGGFLTVSGGTLTASYTSGNKLAISGNISQLPWTLTGPALSVAAGTYTSTSTLTATVTASSFAQPTFAATTASQTITNGATVYIAAAPAAGTNVTITNPYSLYIAAGNSFFGGNILGDFTNATITSRASFQTSTANSTTGIYALPSGTGTAASWQATNNSNPTNASKILIATNGSTDVQLVSGINGSGTYLPLSFYTNGSQSAQLDTAANFTANGQVVAGNGIHVNSKTISTSYTIASGYSGVSAGPITISSGKTVTVSSGSKWVVL